MKRFSQNARALILGAASASCAVIGLWQESRAELPRPEYRRLQREAPEEVRIEVLRVHETPAGRVFDVDVEAKVLRVNRTSVRVHDGEVIHIIYRMHQRERAVPGPGEPQPPERGREYPAYLAKVEGERRAFRPAAGVYTFERL